VHVASTRSSSRASSSSCASSIAEEGSEFSEASDTVAVGGDVFVPPRPVTAATGTRKTQRRKPVVKLSTADRRGQYLAKSSKTVSAEPVVTSAPGWRTRPPPETRPDATLASRSGLLSADSTGSQVPQSLPAAPTTTGVFKVPKTPPVSSLRSRDAGSRIPRTVPSREDQMGVDGATAGRPVTAVGTNAECEVTRAATPPPQKLHSSSSDMALSAASSGSSTRTQSRIPTRGGARRSQRDAGASSRGSSPSSAK